MDGICNGRTVCLRQPRNSIRRRFLLNSSIISVWLNVDLNQIKVSLEQKPRETKTGFALHRKGSITFNSRRNEVNTLIIARCFDAELALFNTRKKNIFQRDFRVYFPLSWTCLHWKFCANQTRKFPNEKFIRAQIGPLSTANQIWR